jgi:hypothetical protein
MAKKSLNIKRIVGSTAIGYLCFPSAEVAQFKGFG